MKGIEIAEHFYEIHGRAMIRDNFPKYEEKMAIGLVGQGSECFGFDDEVSMDHDYGPAFCIWLSREDYQAIGVKLHATYDRLPAEFMGLPTRKCDGRIGVLETNFFYQSQIGRPCASFSLLEWLKIPEFRLATVTNGRVFHDALNAFSKVREDLLRFYPEDVRLKKMAAYAVVMSQSGQYNYARSMCRGETVAAQFALTEFIKSAMLMIFLLNRQYAPFYKWMHRALRELPLLGHLSSLLGELSMTKFSPNLWQNQDRAKRLSTLNKADKIVSLVETLCVAVKEVLQAQGLTDSDDDFLAAHGGEIMKHIHDPQLRTMHILEGISNE